MGWSTFNSATKNGVLTKRPRLMRINDLLFFPQGIGNGDPTDAFPCFGMIFPQSVWSQKFELWRLWSYSRGRQWSFWYLENALYQISVNMLYILIWENYPIVWHIYLYIDHKCTPNVGKYTSPMDPMGITCICITITIHCPPNETCKLNLLVVSTHLKNISFPQVGMNIKNIGNHTT